MSITEMGFKKFVASGHAAQVAADKAIATVSTQKKGKIAQNISSSDFLNCDSPAGASDGSAPAGAPKRRSRAEEERAVRDWNKRAAIGADVLLRKDDGTTVCTKTRSEAWLMGGHSAVIMVEGIAGGYSLHRISLVIL